METWSLRAFVADEIGGIELKNSMHVVPQHSAVGTTGDTFTSKLFNLTTSKLSNLFRRLLNFF
ncbi:hypothetical protein GCM10011339_28060 [Echinicola rosea]|uniref:Uncharacterized protein n=1 Tax=Echinicola rosea TaxID=1807691 RepID=A0ABQ1V6B4_9BACT|nr:hypothetical protein GCM10011339_28060 [Echinicola rosea]